MRCRYKGGNHQHTVGSPTHAGHSSAILELVPCWATGGAAYGCYEGLNSLPHLQRLRESPSTLGRGTTMERWIWGGVLFGRSADASGIHW